MTRQARHSWLPLVASTCLVACAAPAVAPPAVAPPTVSAPSAALPSTPIVDAGVPGGAVVTDAGQDQHVTLAAQLDAGAAAPIDAGPPVPARLPEVWLKGSTHVHARPSGDSRTPVADVIAWYERRGYDFIVLTDHNKVSELDPKVSTAGELTLRPPGDRGLIVFAGIELTHNPSNCVPRGDPQGRCRIHANLLGALARPVGKVVWANRRTDDRLLKYDAVLERQKLVGGIAQLNHPNWFWGIDADLLAALARRGFRLVEIANVAFAKWNDGDADHPSMEAVWDGALGKGVTVWGVASDDAHDYDEAGKGPYPPGGAWITVKARREPSAILTAIAAGRFYASTGVVLERAEVVGGELVVEVAATERGTYTIDFIANGARVARVKGRAARQPVPMSGYVRAVVTRSDGARAWVQPARR